MLGFGEKAVEYFRMINPIEHSRTKEETKKYKVEPYVVAADIYGGSLAGRGGWTWYTGSSSWLYEAGIRYILGLRIEKNMLKIEPNIPADWKEYSIRYRYGESIYNIKVVNKSGKKGGINSLKINGNNVEKNEVVLKNDGRIYTIEVEM